MSSVSVLNVNLYGEHIGTLTNLGGDRTIFAFTDEYIADPERPSLGLAFKEDFGDLYTDFRPYQKRRMRPMALMIMATISERTLCGFLWQVFSSSSPPLWKQVAG